MTPVRGSPGESRSAAMTNERFFRFGDRFGQRAHLTAVLVALPAIAWVAENTPG